MNFLVLLLYLDWLFSFDSTLNENIRCFINIIYLDKRRQSKIMRVIVSNKCYFHNIMFIRLDSIRLGYANKNLYDRHVLNGIIT